MSEVYVPSAVELINLLLPSGGDLRNTGSVNGPMKRLADALAFLQAHPYVLNLVTITDANTTTGTAGTILSPSTCTGAFVFGWGCGGKGASGGTAATNPGYVGVRNVGGGGGGGSRLSFKYVPIVPNTLHSYYVPGSPGSLYSGSRDTTFVNAAVVELFRARGAGDAPVGADFFSAIPSVPAAEYFPINTTTNDPREMYGFLAGGDPVFGTYGGMGIVASPKPFALPATQVHLMAMNREPNRGGPGMSSNAARLATTIGVGGASLEGYEGGISGTAGTDADSTSLGGGVGGGGGAGPGGAGGAGGNGGNASVGGAAQNGANGATAAAGSGGGGGGGGGCGGTIDADTNPGTPSNPGGGGSGKLQIIWLKRS